MNDNSTSGPLDAQFLSANGAPDIYEEMSANGFSLLVKTRRQGRWFILKGLKPEYRDQAVYLELLKKEYELMVQLDHPNVVKAYAKEINESLGPCIVMEYIDGVRLDSFLMDNPSAEARKKVVDQLVDALAYIHSKQIMHRDLKPGNILVTRNGWNVKVIDFGLSDADDYAILKQSAGTKEYMAPEMLSGNGAIIDCKTDIYSFGLVLRKIFPHKYGRIVDKCTRKDRDSRYSSMEAVREALRRQDRRWLRLPFICTLAVLCLAFAMLLKRPSGQMSNPPATENVMPDQEAYLKGGYWLINESLQKLYDDDSPGKPYREILTARLTNRYFTLRAQCSQMGNLYASGSPEQLYFISEFSRELEQNRLRALKNIEHGYPSLEEEYQKGRITQIEYDRMKWEAAPNVQTLAATDITATSAIGTVKLTDDEAFFKREECIVGICWSTCHNPVVTGHHVTLRSHDNQESIEMRGLMPDTPYFARGYVQTSSGTTYGNEISFKTADGSWPLPEGAVRGLFSASDGTQVYFSKGNLQYQASTGTWRFAEHQFDFVGNDNMKISPTWDGWIDLFGWGTSGYDHGAVDYQPWSGNLDTKSDALHYAYGKAASHLYDEDGRADWGYNRIAGGGEEENRWRTPTVSEWVYLLFNRSTLSGVRFAKAQVAGVNGLIILPDNWEIMTYPLNSANDGDAGYNSNEISLSDWTRFLEASGAVFLPEAGVRTIDGVFAHMGGYYTSTAATSDAYHFLLSDFALYFDTQGHRGDGLSVRLVQDMRE